MTKISMTGTKKTVSRSSAKKVIVKSVPKKSASKSSSPKASGKSFESSIRSDALKGTKNISQLLTSTNPDPNLKALLEIAKKLDTIIDLLLAK